MEAWEPRRDFLIGCCGKTEREAEVTTWVELRALEKGYTDHEHAEWNRARFIAHLNYLTTPVMGKGVTKEKDARKFCPFPWDQMTEAELHPKVYKVTKDDVKKLNKIFENIKK